MARIEKGGLGIMKGKIFNAQEVQSILNGSKVMLREVIKPQPIQLEGFSDVYFDCYSKGNPWNWYIKGNKQPLGTIAKCPYQVGQKIFCKEKFSVTWGEGYVWYWADDGRVEVGDWKKPQPAQHMKQEHSRISLLIKEIKVERLAEISEEDAIAEGFKNTFVGFQHPVYNPGRTANQDFEIFWNATHKKPKEKFKASPFVWVISFEVMK